MDLLLHPLKSELNFPIGDKFPLDLSPERWTCAIHALDAVFYVERKSMSVPFHQSGRAHTILAALSRVIEDGFERRALQRSPHLVLLNVEWYHAEMKPIMAQWMMLWLEANHVAGLSTEQIDAYLRSDGASLVGTEWDATTEDAAAADEREHPPPVYETREAQEAAKALRRLHALMRRRVAAKAMQCFNIAAEWLRTFLPHSLAKIDRVSFGLLSMEEYKRISATTETQMPRSRLKLAIPFLGALPAPSACRHRPEARALQTRSYARALAHTCALWPSRAAGKDVPSSASEFAHPGNGPTIELGARSRPPKPAGSL